MTNINKELHSDDIEIEEIDDQSDLIAQKETTVKLDVRRKVENYLEQRELDRLIKDSIYW